MTYMFIDIDKLNIVFVSCRLVLVLYPLRTQYISMFLVYVLTVMMYLNTQFRICLQIKNILRLILVLFFRIYLVIRL